MQDTLQKLIKAGIINSAHDCADGGLMITLLESSYVNNLGFSIQTKNGIRKDAFLFGEAQGRVVLSVSKENFDSFKQYCNNNNKIFELIGSVIGSEAIVDGNSIGSIKDLKETYNNSLEKIILN